MVISDTEEYLISEDPVKQERMEETRKCMSEINMLVEKKYPLKKEILEKMINLKIEVEEDSNMAIELIKCIKSQNCKQSY
ncbi:hypothetical protein Tco_0873356 [Tanacetum coccineum]